MDAEKLKEHGLSEKYASTFSRSDLKPFLDELFQLQNATSGGWIDILRSVQLSPRQIVKACVIASRQECRPWIEKAAGETPLSTC